MKKDSLSFLEKRVILPILSQLALPKHVGFIMDGNRRYAKNLKEPSITGHRMGFDALSSVLLWCFELGLSEVSVYTFSLDNFSRSQEEVEYLMTLAAEKLNLMCEPDSFVMRRNIKVKICGDIALIRSDVREAFEKIQALTVSHTGGQFNIMFAYSSKRELSRAVDIATHTVKGSEISQVSWQAIEDNLYNKTPVDLIVRTSGETRLSDFMIWQIQPRKTLIVFEKSLWPEYNISAFIFSLLRYSVHARTFASPSSQ